MNMSPISAGGQWFCQDCQEHWAMVTNKRGIPAALALWRIRREALKHCAKTDHHVRFERWEEWGS